MGTFAQRAQFGIFTGMDFPHKHVMPFMSPTFGMGLQVSYKPVRSIPVYADLKSSWSIYSLRTLQQNYVFTGGSETTLDVTYKSRLNKFLFGTRIVIGSEYKSYRFYVTPQIGLAAMNSAIYIADPQDEDDCKALEKRKTQRFNGFVYGGELGIDVSLDRIFKGMQTENKHRLNLSLTYLKGFKDFEYVNIKYMMDEDHGIEMQQHNGTNTSGREDIDATFVNVSSNNTHEHKIAELYITPLELIGFNLTYVYSF